MRYKKITKAGFGHMRKWVTPIMILLLLTGLFPKVAFAESQSSLEAKIATAITNSISGSGSNIVQLDGDAVVGYEEAGYQTLTINAPGASIIIDGSKGAVGGEYTISVNPDLFPPSPALNIVGGDVILRNITVKCVQVSGGASLTIGSGAIINTYGYMTRSVTATGVGTKVVVDSGGKVNHALAAIAAYDGASVTINAGGEVNAQDIGIWLDGGYARPSTTISGGTVSGTTGILCDSADVYINSGTVKVNNANDYSTKAIILNNSSSLTATGGTIKGGGRAIDSWNSTVNGYNTLAIDISSSFGKIEEQIQYALEDGVTILLDGDLIGSTEATNGNSYPWLHIYPQGKNITIDGGGHIIYSASGLYVGMTVQGTSGSVTLTNITISGDVGISGGTELIIGDKACIAQNPGNLYSFGNVNVQPGSKLRVKDGGTISGGEIAAIFADGYDTPAEVYVEGGTVTTMSGNTGIDLKNGAKLVVSKGLVENIKMIGGNGITVGDNSQVNVTGGTITGTHTAIRATSAGSRVSASGGKIKGHLQSIAFKQGCTIDVGEGVTLETDVHPEITSSETVAPTAGESNNISLTIKDSSGNVAGAHESLDYPIIITGYNIVPDSSGGNLGGTALSGTSTLVNVSFLNGAATVPLKLNNAATQKISFYPLGESHKSADLSITPAPAQAKRMMVTTQPTGPSVNRGMLTTQPIVKILDEYGNTVTSDYSTMVTASLHGGHDCLLAGVTTVTAVSGVVSFSDLAAYKLTPGEVTTARLQFTSASLPDTYSSLFTISGDTITTGIIAGRVKDSSDNPVSGAKVSLTVDAVEYSATSAADGSYSIADVPAGTDYTVMASKSGYTSGSTANVSVTANTTTSGVNITLTSDLDGCLVTYRGAQKRYNADTDTYDIRFIATIDTLNAKEVGFVFSKSEPIPTRDNATVKATTTVYTSITAAGVTVTAESLGGKYIVAYTITGIPESDINVPLYVRAFSTVGAETKYTTAVTVTVNNLP